MAQYDGSIRINTKIDSKEASSQLATLGNRMQKTADKVNSLREKMDALKNAKIPTKEYGSATKEVEKLQGALEKAYTRKERFLETGGNESSRTFKGILYDIEKLETKLRQAEGDVKNLVNSGKAFILGKDTEKFKSLGQNLKYAENEMSALSQKSTELINKSNNAKNSYVKLGDSVRNSFKLIGKGLIDIPINALKLGAKGAVTAFQKLASVVSGAAKKSIKSFGGIVKKGLLSPLKAVGTIGKSAFSRLSGSAKKSAGGISKFGSRIKELALSALIFNRISAIFNSMTDGMKEGFGNLYKESDGFKNSVNGLKASLLTLKNSLAAAFRPLVEIVIPYIQKAIDYITILMDSVGQLIASMTGQKTYTKAIQQTADAFEEEADSTEEAKEAVEGYLSPLDEINKYNAKNDNDSKNDKGEGGDGAKSPMFEEVPISSKFKNIAQWLKDMWESADFTELGTLLGQKLKSALDNIPWDGIKEAASSIGKSIATLINGFVTVEGLGQSIGNTLAQAINTGFTFLNSFVHNLDWGAIGKFIADTISGFFNGIDWGLIYDTFVTGAQGLGTAINSFVDNLDWEAISTAVSNIVNTFVDTIYTFFNTVDWMNLGTKVGAFISDSLSGINWENLGIMIGTGFQSIFTFLLATIENIEWGNIGTYIATALNGVVESLDLSTVGELLGTAFTGFFDMAINFSKKFDWIKLGDNIAGGINGFFKKFDGAKFAKAATGLITGLLDTIIKTIDETDWAAVWRDIIDFLVNVNWIELIGKLVIAAGKLIYGITKGLIDAIVETDWTDVWNRILTAFKNFFGIHSPSKVMENQGSYIISGLLDGLKNNIGSVLEWLRNIPKWFEEKFELAYKKVKNAFSGAKTFFSGVWEGIKDAFGNISSWFHDKFATAWQAVKNVFSSGGAVFSGIKDGILSSLKSVINSLISGINNVITIPFNGINSALNMIRNANIMGFYPFGWLPYINVPQIPYLAQGTVVPPNKEFLAMLGDNKREPEVVSPLSTIEQAVKNAMSQMGGTNKEIVIKVPVYLDGKMITEIVVKHGKLQQASTGNNIFALG